MNIRIIIFILLFSGFDASAQIARQSPVDGNKIFQKYHKPKISVQAFGTTKVENDDIDSQGEFLSQGTLTGVLSSLFGGDYQLIFINAPEEKQYAKVEIESIYDMESAFKIIEQELSRLFLFSVRDSLLDSTEHVLLLKKVYQERLPVHPLFSTSGQIGICNGDENSYFIIESGKLKNLASFISTQLLKRPHLRVVVDAPGFGWYDFVMKLPEDNERVTYQALNPYLIDNYGLELVDTVRQIQAKVIEFYPTNIRPMGLMKKMESIEQK